MAGKKGDRILGFLFSVGLSLAMHLESAIPAVLLLICHVIFDWSILWFFLALACWILPTVIRLAVIRWACRCSSEKDAPRENKNPYSKR